MPNHHALSPSLVKNFTLPLLLEKLRFLVQRQAGLSAEIMPTGNRSLLKRSPGLVQVRVGQRHFRAKRAGIWCANTRAQTSDTRIACHVLSTNVLRDSVSGDPRVVRNRPVLDVLPKAVPLEWCPAMAKRKGRAFWNKLVDEFEAGDGVETHEEFAARHSVEKATFQRWLHALRKEHRSPASQAVRLLPVRLEGTQSTHTISVALSGGLGLRVQAGTDPSYVAALVAALRSC
jgi:hypothetical protein